MKRTGFLYHVLPRTCYLAIGPKTLDHLSYKALRKVNNSCLQLKDELFSYLSDHTTWQKWPWGGRSFPPPPPWFAWLERHGWIVQFIGFTAGQATNDLPLPAAHIAMTNSQQGRGFHLVDPNFSVSWYTVSFCSWHQDIENALDFHFWVVCPGVYSLQYAHCAMV